MDRKTIFILLASLALLSVLVWARPLAAAEQRFDLTIPGCTA